MTPSQRAVEAGARAVRECRERMAAAFDSPDPDTEIAYDEFLYRAALAAYHDALAVDGVALQGWRTIDSAPKDGSEILATGGGLRDDIETVSYNKDVGCWLTPTCTLDDHDNDPDGYSRPAFWMPKPALPLPAASEGEERK